MADISKEELIKQMTQPLPPTTSPLGSLLGLLGISEDQYNQFAQNPVSAIQGALKPAEGPLGEDKVAGLEGFRNAMNPVLSTLIKSMLPYTWSGDAMSKIPISAPAFTYAFPLKAGKEVAGKAITGKIAPELEDIGHWMKNVKNAAGTEMGQWEVVKEAGDMISKAFDTVGKATENVPVLFGGKAPKGGQLGGFLEGSKRYPGGEIELYKGSKGADLIDNFFHEVGHSLWKAVPEIKKLYADLWHNSPQALKDSLKQLYPNNKLPELIEEFGNYNISKVLGESLGYKKSSVFKPPPEWAEEIKKVLGDPNTFVRNFANKVSGTTEKAVYRTEEIAKEIIDSQRIPIQKGLGGGKVGTRTVRAGEVDLTPRTPEAKAKDIRATRKVAGTRPMWAPKEGDITAQSVSPMADPNADTRTFIDDIVKTIKDPDVRAQARALMEERLLKK